LEEQACSAIAPQQPNLQLALFLEAFLPRLAVCSEMWLSLLQDLFLHPELHHCLVSLQPGSPAFFQTQEIYLENQLSPKRRTKEMAAVTMDL
jgi:hypothetical protein